ncbi:MAG: hypothetical protein GX802_06055 [Clostridiales bacterium]|nr:hypothetical protein [Clostridiales bacterium]
MLGLLVKIIKNLKDLATFAVVALVCVVGYLTSAFFKKHYVLHDAVFHTFFGADGY